MSKAKAKEAARRARLATPQPKLTLKATFSSVEEMEEALAQYQRGAESSEVSAVLWGRIRTLERENTELAVEAGKLKDMTRMRDTAIANVDELKAEVTGLQQDMTAAKIAVEEMAVESLANRVEVRKLRRCKRRPFAGMDLDRDAPTQDECLYVLPRHDCQVLEVAGETLAELKQHAGGKVSTLLSLWKRQRDTIGERRDRARKVCGDLAEVELALTEMPQAGLRPCRYLMSWGVRDGLMTTLKDVQEALEK